MIVNTQSGSGRILAAEGLFEKKDEGKYLIIPKIHFYSKMLHFISGNVFEVEKFPHISIGNTEALIVETQAEAERWAKIERG